MRIETQMEIKAPADKVWQVVGEQFNDIANWASFVSQSHANPEVGEGEGRVCQTDFGPVTENITAFQPQSRSLSHSIEGSSTPFFMRDVLNHWHIEEAGKGASTVTFAISANVMPPFKQLLSRRLQDRFGRQARGYVRELKHFVETGEPVRPQPAN